MINENFPDKIGRNIFFNFVNIVIVTILGVATSIFVARVLGPVRMGAYTFLLWLIGTGVMIINLGFPTLILRYIPELFGRNEHKTARSLFARVFKIEVIIALSVTAGFILSFPFIANFYKKLGIHDYLLITSLCLFPVALGNYFSAAAKSLQKFEIVARVNLISMPIAFLITLIVLLLGGKVSELLIVYLGISFFSLILFSYFIRKDLPFSGGTTSSEVWSRAFRYSMSVLAIIIFDVIIWQRSEIFFLGYFSSPKEVAFYSLAFGASMTLIGFIPKAFLQTLIPVMSEIWGSSDKKALNLVYILSTRYVMIIILPIATILFVLARPIINIVYGISYAPAFSVFQILLISSTVGVIAQTAVSLLHGAEKQKIMVKWGAVFAIINILLDLCFIPKFAAIGAAIANSIVQISIVILIMNYVCSEFKIHLPVISMIKTIIGAIIMAFSINIIVTGVAGIAGIVFSVAAGIIVYSVCLRYLKVLGKEDLRIIEKVMGNAPGFKKICRPLLKFLDKAIIKEEISIYQ